ncbi:hypothetical protein KM043_017706 [Ampulex compressa]|nr:hypothetical protein KM043_017706 [Ampulex compressa]
MWVKERVKADSTADSRRRSPIVTKQAQSLSGPMAGKWHEAINWPNTIEQPFEQRSGELRWWSRLLRVKTSSLSIGRLVLKYAAILRPPFDIGMFACDLVRACLTTLFFGVVFGAIPPYIKICRKRDPGINKCITNSIEELRGKLAEGIPELEAPAIEPLNLKQIRLLRGPVGARLDVNLTDIQVFGPSTFQVRDLEADVDNVIFTFKVNFDNLSFKGKYQIDARILLLRLSGNGDLSGNFTGYNSNVTLKANKVYRNNDTYLDFEKMKLAIKIGGADVYLSNLFGGDPVLGPATNQILNANSALFLDEIRPILESSLADLFTDVTNKITKSFTYNELFPDE